MNTISELLIAFCSGKQCGVKGRVAGRRDHGQIIFFDLRDSTGQIQLIFDHLCLGDLPELGDIVEASGEFCLSSSGERSVALSSLNVLTTCLDPRPLLLLKGRHNGVASSEQSVSLLSRIAFLQRVAEFYRAIRNDLYVRGFLEFDTSVLQREFNGGFSRPFVTKCNSLRSDVYLRVTSELRLKQLVIAGHRRVFEMGKVFRNEGLDRMHSPEFTFLEIYEGFSDYQQMMTLVEEVLRMTSMSVFGENNFTAGKVPWPRISLLGMAQDVFGKDFSFRMDTKQLLALGEKKLPGSKN